MPDKKQKLKCDVNHLKVKFYRAFNSVYARSKAANSELVTVQLMKSYCLNYCMHQKLHLCLLPIFVYLITALIGLCIEFLE